MRTRIRYARGLACVHAMNYVERMMNEAPDLRAIAVDELLVDGIATGRIRTGGRLTQALVAWRRFAYSGNGPQIASTGPRQADPRVSACAHASNEARPQDATT